jgi:DNA-directed RNA polymerase specialized sigma24 family protein
VLDSHEQRIGERVDTGQRARTVAGVLAGLPRRQRDVLLLIAVAEFEYSEVATALGAEGSTT